MKLPIFIVAALGLAALTACSDKPPETPASASGDTQGQDQAMQDKYPDKDPNKGNIQIGPKLAKLCAIPEAYFPFDSASLSPQASKALDALAACFVSGAAKDESMSIVGHADPRGETDYNFALGQRRAGTVEKELTKRKVPSDRIESSSRGELDASGTDEASWAKDRRVDIVLAE